MRCILCGAEMRLVQAARDETMMVPGYEDQTLECPECNEIERRRVFNGERARVTGAAVPAASVAEQAFAAASAAIQALSKQQALPDSPAEAAAPDLAPITSMTADGDEEVDEAEELLRRAIEMVRAPIGGPKPLRGLTDDLKTAAAPPPSAPERKVGTGRVVQIRHDPSYDAAYAAKDIKTGLVVLRHQDNARLRAMCDRLGWQVMEDGAPLAEG